MRFSVDYIIDEIVLQFTIREDVLARVDIVFSVCEYSSRKSVASGAVRIYIERNSVLRTEVKDLSRESNVTENIVRRAADTIMTNLSDLIKEHCCDFVLKLALGNNTEF